MALAVAPAGAPAKPKATLSRASALPGQELRLKARGFPARKRVRVSLAGRLLARKRTGRRGRISVLIEVPDLDPGRYVARVRRGRTVARRGLTVLPLPQPLPEPEPEPPPPPPDPPTLVAAGDIACSPNQIAQANPAECHHPEVAELVTELAPDVVATLGDAQYQNGELVNYQNIYDPTWGVFKGITRPAAGNHEYLESPTREEAVGHFTYFGDAAGDPDEGYYSYELGDWSVFVLNTGEINYARTPGGDPAGERPDDCWPVSCAVGSPQEQWLRAELEALPPGACALAYWHHPVYSSGNPGDNPETQPVWDALQDHGVELLLTGHTHAYERFAADGGVRQFIVGTGGRSLFPGFTLKPGSEFFDNTRYGVLELTLAEDGYEWRFVAEDRSVTDSGTGACQPAP